MKKKYMVIPIVILAVLILAFSVPAMVSSLTVAQIQPLAKPDQSASPLEYPKPLGHNASDKIAPSNAQYYNILNPESLYYYLNPASPYYGISIPLCRDLSHYKNYTPPPCPEPDQSTFPVEHSKPLYPDKSGNIPQALVVSPSPGEGYGTGMYDNYENRTWGVYAGQEVRPDLSLPSAPPDRALYAPTLMCPNHCPLESVTMYYRYEGMGSTARAWGIWNHSRSKPPYWELIRPMD